MVKNYYNIIIISIFLSFLFSQSCFAVRVCYLGEMKPIICEKHLNKYELSCYSGMHSSIKNYLTLIPKESRPECHICPKCLYLRQNSQESDYCKGCKSVIKKWECCNTKTWNTGYFRIENQKYRHFFFEYLRYCADNPTCKCFWPEYQNMAAVTNQHIITLFNMLLFHDILKKDFSPFWNSQLFQCKNQKLPCISLATHVFFYSHLKQVVFDVLKYSSTAPYDPKTTPHAMKIFEGTLGDIEQDFLQMLNECLAKHPHPKIYYERGLLQFQLGNNIEAIDDMYHLISYNESNKENPWLSSELNYQQGLVCSEIGDYEKAIQYLSQAIEQDPKNKTLYLERANAYFELGYFENAIKDYKSTDFHSSPIPTENINKVQFSLGFTKGACKGLNNGCIEFIPSMLSSLHGIGHALWATVEDPIGVSCEIIDSSQACVEFIRNHSTQETLQELVPELKELVLNWKNYDDSLRGESIGYIIGKYGVDIFGCAGAAKCVKAFRNLKRANSLYTLEKCASSTPDSARILAEASKRLTLRKEVLKNGNLKIHWDKQNKHVQGSHNYIPDRSIFEHPDPQRLINEYAGTGKRINNEIPGTSNYREIIDFNEHIGIWKNNNNTLALPTTRGTVHYSKTGVHIVPAEPRPIYP